MRPQKFACTKQYSPQRAGLVLRAYFKMRGGGGHSGPGQNQAEKPRFSRETPGRMVCQTEKALDLQKHLKEKASALFSTEALLPWLPETDLNRQPSD